MNEAHTTEGAAPRRDRRKIPALGLIAGILLIGALAALWVRVADPFNPYRPGTVHQAVLVHEQPGCMNRWGVGVDSGGRHYHWGRGAAPADWEPGPVEGTLTILHDWGATGTDAVFEANGQTVNLTGGSRSGVHWDDQLLREVGRIRSATRPTVSGERWNYRGANRSSERPAELMGVPGG